ncbi:MAG: VOC family protein [Pararhodobacter sp.]|nr:VOC family protein [Pararhodobacter sp.]
MTDRILDIDHLMINTPDAGATGDAFEHLGFIVTPESLLPGLVNRLICFGDTDATGGICNYVELMCLSDPALAPAPMPTLLAGPFGPVSTVMAVDDAEAATQRLKGLGLQIGPVLHLDRAWQLPDGDVIRPAFAVAIPEPGQAPFYWNYCQHKTPQHYVRAEFTAHPNGVTRMLAVLAVHPDPLTVASAYQAQWGGRVEGENPARITAGKVALEVFTPEAFAARYGGPPPAPGLRGMCLRSRDLATTLKAMPSATRRSGALIASVGPAGETILEIVGSDADR